MQLFFTELCILLLSVSLNLSFQGDLFWQRLVCILSRLKFFLYFFVCFENAFLMNISILTLFVRYIFVSCVNLLNLRHYFANTQIKMDCIRYFEVVITAFVCVWVYWDFRAIIWFSLSWSGLPKWLIRGVRKNGFSLVSI